MSERDRVVAAFAAGVAFMAAVLMAYQDWLGRDVYLRRVAETWVDCPWWIGSGAACLAILAYIFNLAGARR